MVESFSKETILIPSLFLQDSEARRQGEG